MHWRHVGMRDGLKGLALAAWLVTAASGAPATNASPAAGPGIPLGQNPPVTKDGIVYDAAADFAKSWDEKKNPDGAWKFGWTKGLHGDFVLFPLANVSPIQNQRQHVWIDPSNTPAFTPSIRLNDGPDYNDGNVDYKAGALLLHGGGEGWDCYAHAVWTAPDAGSYLVEIVLTGSQYDVDADAHILVNGVSSFDAAFTHHGDQAEYTHIFYFHAGDTVDVASGLNGDYTPHPGFVAINAVIQKLKLSRPDNAIIPSFPHSANST